jgi:hypothetical protein
LLNLLIRYTWLPIGYEKAINAGANRLYLIGRFHYTHTKWSTYLELLLRSTLLKERFVASSCHFSRTDEVIPVAMYEFPYANS